MESFTEKFNEELKLRNITYNDIKYLKISRSFDLGEEFHFRNRYYYYLCFSSSTPTNIEYLLKFAVNNFVNLQYLFIHINGDMKKQIYDPYLFHQLKNVVNLTNLIIHCDIMKNFDMNFKLKKLKSLELLRRFVDESVSKLFTKNLEWIYIMIPRGNMDFSRLMYCRKLKYIYISCISDEDMACVKYILYILSILTKFKLKYIKIYFDNFHNLIILKKIGNLYKYGNSSIYSSIYTTKNNIIFNKLLYNKIGLTFG